MWRAHTSSLRSATSPLLTRGCGFGQRGACTVKCAKRRCQQRCNAPHPEAKGVKGACGIRPEPRLRAREFPSADTGSAQTRDRATRAGPKPLPHTLAPSHPEGHTNAKSMKNMHRTNSDMHMQASAPSAARARHCGEVNRPRGRRKIARWPLRAGEKPARMAPSGPSTPSRPPRTDKPLEWQLGKGAAAPPTLRVPLRGRSLAALLGYPARGVRQQHAWRYDIAPSSCIA